jgi:hypothetical protein
MKFILVFILITLATSFDINQALENITFELDTDKGETSTIAGCDYDSSDMIHCNVQISTQHKGETVLLRESLLEVNILVILA